jgi:hypothetical protein
MLISGVVSLLTLLKTKNVTLASVPLFVLLPFLGWIFNVSAIYIVYGMVLPCLVALTHLSRVWKQVPHSV